MPAVVVTTLVHCAVFLSFFVCGAVASPPQGGLEQLNGKRGCVSETGSNGACARGRSLESTSDVVVSPDGRNVYTVRDGGVAAFARSEANGELTQLDGPLGCLDETGDHGCRLGRSLRGAYRLAVSSDGRNLYAVARFAAGVAVLRRDAATGSLTQAQGAEGCINDGGSAGCAVARAVDGPYSVAVSPDGRHVYVAALDSDAVAVFERTAEGALVQLSGPEGCISDAGRGGCVSGRALSAPRSVAVSADGRNVYSVGLDSLATFVRDDATGALRQLPGPEGCLVSHHDPPSGCAVVDGLSTLLSVAASLDGRSVYATTVSATNVGSSAVFRLDRDQATGALHVPPPPDKTCFGASSSANCDFGWGLRAPWGLAISLDGRRVYVAGGSEGVAVLDRGPGGRLSQQPEPNGCIADEITSQLPCRRGRALAGVTGIAVSPDGQNVYAAASRSDAIAVLARPIARVTTRRAKIRHGRMKLQVQCYIDPPGHCNGTLTLRSNTRMLARRSVSLPAGTSRHLRVRVSRSVRNQIRRQGRRAATATLQSTDGRGHERTNTSRVMLVASAQR